MKNFKPKAWMLPQPVLILGTYDADGTPNAMNAALKRNSMSQKPVTISSLKFLISPVTRHIWQKTANRMSKR